MQLLLLSSSRVNNSDYLAPYMPWVKQALQGINELLFIPYAGVSSSYDEYLLKVQQAFKSTGIIVSSIHQHTNPKTALQNAQAICVGGGNTFHLLYQLYQLDIIDTIKERVTRGVPYIGWSAGANIAGASIKTTNDMPIIQPASFDALGFLPCQLNPHYQNFSPKGFHGETRDMRLAEFMRLNPTMPIIGLPEGSALVLKDSNVNYIGQENGYYFLDGVKSALAPNSLIRYKI
ncbi:dipeptidase PepE [Rheinheimera baltica]|uniref:dipeptidase PepE n=1 Tax=Rheinheimera baltica TaxID=67576 RepID=UPI0003F7A943|nr:dipeptidase PepE [Rheinheimera baltica]